MNKKWSMPEDNITNDPTCFRSIDKQTGPQAKLNVRHVSTGSQKHWTALMFEHNVNTMRTSYVRNKLQIDGKLTQRVATSLMYSLRMLAHVPFFKHD